MLNFMKVSTNRLQLWWCSIFSCLKKQCFFAFIECKKAASMTDTSEHLQMFDLHNVDQRVLLLQKMICFGVHLNILEPVFETSIFCSGLLSLGASMHTGRSSML